MAKIDFDNILLSSNNGFEITDIVVRNYITYFKINGQQYCTYGSKIHHEKSVMYDHPVTLIAARNQNDPVKILEDQDTGRQVNEEIDLMSKYKYDLYQRVFVKAYEALQKGGYSGRKAFIDAIDKYFFVTLEDPGKELLKQIAKK